MLPSSECLNNRHRFGRRHLIRVTRQGLELDVIAAYRATMRRSPDCQFMAGESGEDL